MRGTISGGIGKEEIKNFGARWFHEDASIMTSGMYANMKLCKRLKRQIQVYF